MKEVPFDDPHAERLGRVVVGLLSRGAEAVPATEIAWPRRPADPKLPTLSSPLVGSSGVEVPVTDEDIEQPPAWLRTVARTAVSLRPVHDAARPWASDQECADALDQLFGSWLPRPDVDWGAVRGPEGLARFARQGLAAHRLEATPDGGFVLDLDTMAPYAVRRGYASYGGVLRLDAEGRFVALERGGRSISPHADEFEHEALAFRSTALLLVTVVDHMGTVHLGVSNALLLSVRRTLGPDHPLRQFLRPFQFKTGGPNRRSVTTLVPKNAFLHRMCGLEWDALQDLYRTVLLGVRFEPFPERLKRQGTHPSQLGTRAELLPWSDDGVVWYDGLAGFVDDAVKSSRALGSALSPAYLSATQRFWDELGRHIRDLPPLDLPGLTATLTWLLHVVTALHTHVGNIAAHVRNPSLGPGRVIRGAMCADRQNTANWATLAAFTGVPEPTIADSWHHLMPDDGARQAALRFNHWLMEFQDEVDTRNAGRQQAFIPFSPRVMTCSVSR